jgi:pimeloyl-ACP methyl ester carboxylesterase
LAACALAPEESELSVTLHKDIWFESQGTRLYTRQIGSGHPVVFLHGGLADHRAAELVAGPLSTAYRVILPDLRGSGRSLYSAELSWQALADDLSALLDHLGIQSAAIGGSSMGSGVALRFALSHPGRVLGLILMSPVYPGNDRGLSQAQTAAMQAIGAAGQTALEHGVQALIPLYARLPEPIRERAIAMLRDFDASSLAATTRLLASQIQPFESNEQLAQLDVPSLLIPGTDAEHPVEVAELYAQKLPRARIAQPGATLPASLTSFCAALPWPN